MRKIVTGNTQQKGFVDTPFLLKTRAIQPTVYAGFRFCDIHLKCFTKRRGPTSRRWAGALPIEPSTAPVPQIGSDCLLGIEESCFKWTIASTAPRRATKLDPTRKVEAIFDCLIDLRIRS